ncbi:zinc ABC transporter permease subunit ZnuB [Buchnera aphidicola]|uniref:zinc ABC transporter permease subunit ZnuB n=1 Tax=Buchnera aphidicola TaxID=9 RepID=UPI003BEF0B0F
MFELILPGWIAGIFLALATGPLGSLMLWRRMSSFGDTLSHSSLLGLALSIIFDINPFYSVLIFIVFLSILLAWLEEIVFFSIDTTLSIISHSSLSLGIIFMSLIAKTKKIDINSYLFGDLLTVKISDVIIIAVISIIVMSILLIFWNTLLFTTISEELAKIDGINLYYSRLIMLLTTALTISMAIKFVGALLITSLLIIPPATSQYFSNSPEKIVFISIIISILSITGGIFLSVFYNIPTSPSIVLFCSFFFLLSYIKKYVLFVINYFYT